MNPKKLMNPVRNRSGDPDFIVFSIGDSRKPSTWSNVPYFFTRTLERKGFSVERVNIGPPRSVQLLFDVPWKALCRVFGKQTRFTYLRSALNRRITEAKIKRTLQAFPQGHCVFMTYSFGAGPGRPYTLFCDQTFEDHIVYYDERKPDKLEHPTIVAERMNLRNAGHVVAFFPELAEKLKVLHGDKVKYYGNVVNIDDVEVDAERLIQLKKDTNEVVFIGNNRYKEGLVRLVDAVRLLNRSNAAQITVNVVGMDRLELPTAPANVKFHGYLDKGDPAQKRAYLDILERSRLFINPMPKWGAFSASCEAMYLYTPVVIVAYNEFEATFGKVDRVGFGLATGEPRELAEAIAGLMTDERAWVEKAHAAHATTQAMTWGNYVSRLLSDLGIRSDA